LIIDGDTHISPAGGDFSLENQLAAVERAGIDKALVWLSPHHYKGGEVEEHNAFVAKAARRHAARLIPFGWADPGVGVRQAKDLVRRCAQEWGVVGVKLNGAQNNFFIDDPEVALPVAEEIARQGRAIAFHIGPDAYERTHPTRAARVAKLFPETPVLMIHMGMTSWDMHRAVCEAAIRRLGASRVCFGSDWPFRKIHVVRAMFEAALTDEMPPADMELFMGGNLQRILAIR
jgi:predicted TIM-barrel fold metal-dependent hydrolase